MKKKLSRSKTALLSILLLFCLFFSGIKGFASTDSALSIQKLTVEYENTPLGIDVKAPHFGWQMSATAGERNLNQTAYQIVVKDLTGNLVWDTKKVSSSKSVGIEYAGSALKAATRYNWIVTVWDQKGASSSGSSWFETGLMNSDPALSAWNGATWIGGSNDDLVLYSSYLAIFDLKYKLTIEKGSTRASFIYGANDSRLMNKYLNIFQVENKKNESYIKIELDISAVDGTENGKAKLNIYRVGYKSTDSPATPLKTFEVQTKFIDNSNKNNEHLVSFSSKFGSISISLDGSSSFITAPAATSTQTPSPGVPQEVMRRIGGNASVVVNPAGSGGDVLCFGMLCDMGFSVDAGQKATFSEVVVSNNRFPNSTLFSENLSGTTSKSIYSAYAADANSGLAITDGKYILSGGNKGTLVIANPSRNSMPMLRSAFNADEKKIAGARLYVTSRGIYEVYLNGKKLGDDYYNPGLTQYNITPLYQN